MNIRKRIGTIGAAALLAVAVVGFTATAADAKPRRPRPQPVLCSIAGSELFPPSSLDIEFFTPGQQVPLGDGYSGYLWVQCGADGRFRLI